MLRTNSLGNASQEKILPILKVLLELIKALLNAFVLSLFVVYFSANSFLGSYVSSSSWKIIFGFSDLYDVAMYRMCRD